ncbi:hypothetical protein JA1_004923 [Spathaspora sp. JA1]|nr:hypothetical protein JA1_004923 [Spathaspora sp. JA1]
MKYPSDLTPTANKQQLCEQYVGKSIKELPTPSIVIDRSQFRENCQQMIVNAKKINADFRPHIKTHKTLEGCIEQIGSNEAFTDKIVVSTMMEAWGVLQIPQIQDIHYSLPVVKSRIPEFASFSSRVTHFRLMLDQCDQLDALASYRERNPSIKKWSVFIKVDMGTHRAGLPVGDQLEKLLEKALKDPRISEHVGIHGLYCHAGHSYSSTSEKMAKHFLIDEINFANNAALQAKSIDPGLQLILSVGATPTANASGSLSLEELLEKIHDHKLEGKLELHAGNYSCCDLQQLATGCITQANISLSVLSEIVSTYPGRGENAPGEQLINAGVLALAREFSTIPGHGRIIEPTGFGEWIVGRLSQEHGVLTPLNDNCKFIPYGTQVRVIPQHACIAAAAHPFFFVIGEDNDTVVDVWVPLRGW